MLRVLKKRRGGEVISLSLGLIPNTLKGSIAFCSRGSVLLLQSVCPAVCALLRLSVCWQAGGEGTLAVLYTILRALSCAGALSLNPHC